MIRTAPAPTGSLTIIKRTPSRYEEAARHGRLVRDDEHGHYWASRGHLRHHLFLDEIPIQQRVLAWLRDNIHPAIPRAWYQLMVGHDIHLADYGRLWINHFHSQERDPFTGRDTGWTEDRGLSSCGKVTTAFRDFESLMLVTDATTIGDFKFHRPGLSTQAEANTDTALITDAGLEATGNQSNPTAPTYQSVGTVTADVTETWTEHSLRNATGAAGGTMMDRSVYTGVAVVASDTVQYTYVLTKNAEA